VSADDIIAFLTVAERGGFTAAAAHLRQPKTTISRRVRALEARLGVRLLERTTRAVALTEAGDLYREKLAGLPGLLGDAEQAVADLRGEPRGWIRLALPHSLATSLVSGLIARFGERYPRVRFDLVLGHQLLDLVRDDIDIALRLGPLPDSTLISRLIARLPNRIHAAPAYLGRHPAPSSPLDLASHATLANRIAQRPGGFAWELSDGGPLSAWPIEPVIVADDPDALIGALSAGRGLMLATDLVVRDLVEAGSVVPVLSGWTGRSPELHALYPSGRAQLAKIRLFLDFLAKTAAPAAT
jgi:DNA-binding transcriptional LysR family regulator